MSASSTDRMTSLRRCWHPVAYGADLGAAPRAADLLGHPLVLWRDSRGAAHAFDDLCVHRGTALSLGGVRGDELICAYHGWRYGGDGACTFIPQLPDPTQVPARARATAYRCQERYGLLWVALEEPRWPLPEVPELEDAAWSVVRTGPFAWRCEASRQVENFTDFGHFAFVHPGLLGDPERPVVAPYEVRTEGHVLRYDYARPDSKNTEDFPVYAEAGSQTSSRLTSYALHLPYTIVEYIGWPCAVSSPAASRTADPKSTTEKMVYFFASQPVALDRCIGYCLVARNYNLDQPASVVQEFERVIFAQDQRVVESQRPEAVPFDLAAELHLRFDAVAVAYRRAMRAHGLA
jgi:phenylpropionate dioxygenase-like ring-hydroxylating dioxygenase large terminal subunit